MEGVALAHCVSCASLFVKSSSCLAVDSLFTDCVVFPAVAPAVLINPCTPPPPHDGHVTRSRLCLSDRCSLKAPHCSLSCRIGVHARAHTNTRRYSADPRDSRLYSLIITFLCRGPSHPPLNHLPFQPGSRAVIAVHVWLLIGSFFSLHKSNLSTSLLLAT